MPRGCCAPPRPVVDSALLAAKIASVRDATARVRAVLPGSGRGEMQALTDVEPVLDHAAVGERDAFRRGGRPRRRLLAETYRFWYYELCRGR